MFTELNVCMCVNGILYVDQFLYCLTHTNVEETVHVGMCFVSKEGKNQVFCDKSRLEYYF